MNIRNEFLWSLSFFTPHEIGVHLPSDRVCSEDSRRSRQHPRRGHPRLNIWNIEQNCNLTRKKDGFKCVFCVKFFKGIFLFLLCRRVWFDFFFIEKYSKFQVYHFQYLEEYEFTFSSLSFLVVEDAIFTVLPKTYRIIFFETQYLTFPLFSP